MKQFISKQWPFLLHLAASGIVLVTPDIKTIAAAHPAYTMLIMAIWGKLLHWAESPRS